MIILNSLHMSLI